MAYLDPPECSSTRGGNSVSKIYQKQFDQGFHTNSWH